MIEKPDDIFDRRDEWDALARFMSSERARFGLVYGRRRQGKSWLLERLAERAGGWYWEAIEGTTRQQLDAFGERFRVWTRAAAPVHFADWAAALEATWTARPSLFVLDEFRYLVASAPSLPSILQGRVSRPGGPRTIICGSALGAMSRLLAADAPLRGRASLELLVRPFDFRSAARYWGSAKALDDAVSLHALVGGTPAYLDYAGGRTPAKLGDFDDWVCEVLLNPAGALFREGRILTDEPSLSDRGMYFGLLAAVAGGATRRGQIAAILGRAENTLAHPLNALVDLSLLERIDDPLHARRSFFRLAEPMLRTYQVLVAPNEGAIERRGARRVWSALAATASSQIYGPHFEQLAREWVARFASDETLGGQPQRVGPSVVGDARAKREREIDVVATVGDQVIAIGEAKWQTQPVGIPVLAELEHKRALSGTRAAGARLLLFARSGFTPELRVRARQRGSGIELVDLDRLYRGE